MLYLFSTVAMVLIAVGLASRKRNRPVHLKMMVSAFVIDLSLLVYIELTRGAVEIATRDGNGLVLFHASVSVTVLALYIAMLALGLSIVQGKRTSRPLHFNLGITFCLFRTINFVTSFMM